MNVILIDDEAGNGWKEVLEKVLFVGTNIDFALNDHSAKTQLLSKEYDLILLDLRFGEIDHKITDISQFSGFKILINYIRNEFSNINFSTPVILFTASNKAWNIFEMYENGIDSFYIKEHPDTAYDYDFSRQNYKRLKEEVPRLLELGDKRRDVWQRIQNIINNSSNTVSNKNISYRIEEKLKIGYGLLFRKTTKVENTKLLFNNEVNAFIVFWSILEEIVKDSFRDNWIKTGHNEGKMTDNNWVLKSGKVFIEDLRTENFGKTTGVIKVNIDRQSGQFVAKEKIVNFDNKEIHFYEGKLNLSLQVYAVLLLEKNWAPSKVTNHFKPLNEYRNEIDFIHSSLSSIFNNKLSSLQNNKDAFKKCILMLDFLDEIVMP